MDGMIAPLQWPDIALRLAVTIAVGLVIGYNRSEHSKAAGMRTTLLVCLAASVSMIQVNLLLPTAGRPPGSFVMNDLMRFPLGILTGVGFIGGGAILRRESLVIGVTTAATLWLVTVIGLCIGGGQIALGLAATVIGVLALWCLKWLEAQFSHETRARLTLTLESGGAAESEIAALLHQEGFSVTARGVALDAADGIREATFEVGRMRRRPAETAPDVVRKLGAMKGVRRLRWDEVS